MWPTINYIVQWLDVADKIPTFPLFSGVFREHLVTNESTKCLKVGHLRFLKLKELEILKETDKRLLNYKCQIDNTVCTNSLKREF